MKPAQRGLKIYGALTWDRGFELLHRAQRHTNPIDPRPRLDASAYLGRARRHADQLIELELDSCCSRSAMVSWRLEHRAQPTTEARRSPFGVKQERSGIGANASPSRRTPCNSGIMPGARLPPALSSSSARRLALNGCLFGGDGRRPAGAAIRH
jgi:hypothetical protein